MKNIKGKSFLLTICLIAFCATAFKSGCDTGASERSFFYFWLIQAFGGDDPPRDGLPLLYWSGGEAGAIFRTNNGIDWFPENSGPSNDLNGACGLSPSTADTTVWSWETPGLF